MKKKLSPQKDNKLPFPIAQIDEDKYIADIEELENDLEESDIPREEWEPYPRLQKKINHG